jgi:uncharacterized membrane protein YgcG
MKNRIHLVRFVIIFFVFSLSTVVSAQSTSQEESITSFVSTIKVNLDSSIDVDEVITYTTGPVSHHGIFRDIRTTSSTGEKMKISNIKVVNEIGNPYNFVYSGSGDNVQVKIGDANVVFNGQKIYHLSYHASNAVAHLKDIDEIYWNATGNNWTFPIYSVSTTVTLPLGVIAKQNACYQGVNGSKEQCISPQASSSETYLFSSTRKLSTGEGLTIATGFDKGVVIPSLQEEVGNINITQQNNASLSYQVTPQLNTLSGTRIIGSFSFLAALFALMYVFWYKNWRDPKGTNIIVPQYDVPDGLTPLEVEAIADESLGPLGISAEIIYLATQGYLTIKQIETKIIFSFTKTDYEIHLIRGDTHLLAEFDQSLIGSLFKKNSTIVLLSDLQGEFYRDLDSIFEKVGESLLSKGYYENLGKIARSSHEKVSLSSLAPVLVIPVVLLAGILGDGFLYPAIITPFSLIIVLIFAKFNPKKTVQGVATMEYLLGLKQYLSVAEKDRLEFHNAPEKKPEIFEKLLPYAIVFQVDKAWAKEFEGIYVTPPSWYEGGTQNTFTSSSFATTLSAFNSAALSASASSSSGGSGGGGSSGGGGGGGGGGSW